MQAFRNVELNFGHLLHVMLVTEKKIKSIVFPFLDLNGVSR